jgi:hypothetical protein
MGAPGKVSGGGRAQAPAKPAPRGRQWWWLDLLVTLLLGAGALALYVRCLAPGVLQGDAGELQFAPYLLGVPHPTGYPLYSLLGWAWSHALPLGSTAYRMNLFSSVWAALAVGLLYPAGRTLLRQSVPGLSPLVERLVAGLAAALLAVTPTFWSQAVIAEVYGMNAFFVVLILYLILTWGEKVLTPLPGREGQGEGGSRLLLVACVFGLSLAHHRTTLLLAPALLAYVWSVERRIFRQGRLLLKVALLVPAPLLLYVYIPWRAAHSPYLHLSLGKGQELALYQDTLRGFLAYCLGGAYTGSLDWGIDVVARLSLAARFFRGDLSWAVLALALAGLAALIGGRRWRVLALTGLTFLALVGFCLVYTIGDIRVLFIPAFLIAVLWAAIGVAALCWLASRLPGLPVSLARALPITLAVAACVLPAWLGTGRFAAMDRSHSTGVETAWRAILANPLPQDAILVTDNRDEIMPMWYFQYGGDSAAVRRDLLGLFPLITPEYPTIGHILDLALGTGRPVYLIKEMPGLDVKVRVQPEAGLWRVLGTSAEREPAHRLGAELGGALLLVGYDLAPETPGPGESLEVSLRWEALGALSAVYHSYVHLLDAEGNKVVQSDRQPGGVYYPTTKWRVDERLLDRHALAVPEDAPPGAYHLVAGMYKLDADGTLAAFGEPVALGEVRVR